MQLQQHWHSETSMAVDFSCCKHAGILNTCILNLLFGGWLLAQCSGSLFNDFYSSNRHFVKTGTTQIIMKCFWHWIINKLLVNYVFKTAWMRDLNTNFLDLCNVVDPKAAGRHTSQKQNLPKVNSSLRQARFFYFLMYAWVFGIKQGGVKGRGEGPGQHCGGVGAC